MVCDLPMLLSIIQYESEVNKRMHSDENSFAVNSAGCEGTYFFYEANASDSVSSVFLFFGVRRQPRCFGSVSGTTSAPQRQVFDPMSKRCTKVPSPSSC